MNATVIYIVFNRPEHTRKSFSRIRAARPSKLYVLADGPRKDKKTDIELCREVRDIILEGVDWECQLITDFSDVNLGCKRRIGGGLTRVFEQEERAIILEDDCLPHPSFFDYCSMLLEKYSDNKRIGQISGLNVLWNRLKPETDYYYSRYPLCWGWATWADRWQHWDGDLKDWHDYDKSGGLEDWLQSSQEVGYWRRVFDQMTSGNPPWNAWDYGWTFTHFKKDWLAIAPSVNLVTNIGWGEQATHTAQHNQSLAPPARALYPPYKGPKDATIFDEADRMTFRTYCLYEEARWWKRWWNQFRIQSGRIKKKMLRANS